MRILFRNGRVWTGTAANPWTDAVLVERGVILAIGSLALGGAEPDRTVDLGGRFMGPGFVEGHGHLLSAGRLLATCDLRGVGSRAEFVACVRRFAAGRPAGSWIEGGRWNADRWPDGAPARADLDAATGGRPALLSRSDGHLAVANSAALALAGIGAQGPDPTGGVVERDADGTPTGVLKELAVEFAARAMPRRSEEETAGALGAAMAEVVTHGITTFHAMCSLSEWYGLKSLRDAGRLRARVTAYVAPDAAALLEDGRWRLFLAELLAERRSPGDDTLRLCGVKLFYDGSLGARTALFAEPYADRPDGFRGVRCGLDPALLTRRLADLAACGLQPAIHAIGDLAVEEVLTSWIDATAGRRQDVRLRIEHAQHLLPGAPSRLAQHGVVVSMQPRQIPGDIALCERLLGHERCRRAYALRELLDAGVTLALGSDWPVVALSPLPGIDAAVTRRSPSGDIWTPEQRISLAEALRSYTAGGAAAEDAAERKGTIAPGHAADFVVLSDDPLAAAPDNLARITVERTVVAGETVYDRVGV